MNVFFVLAEDTIVTPPADGTILAGITRDSVIELARHLGYRVSERRFSVSEWAAAARSGQLSEVFATGTAAVVTPVARLVGQHPDGARLVIDTPVEGLGPVASTLRDELAGIQSGARADRFGWMDDIVGPAPSVWSDIAPVP